MPRSIWNGTVTFGLIAVPIKVHSATEDRSVHFHQVHSADGARIKQKRICSEEGTEVPYEEVAKGYEVADGEYVVLSQDEINAAAGEGAQAIALDAFVCAADIDPVLYNRTYYLGAGDGGQDAYRLLHDGLARSRRAGIGRWVFHNREYLVAIRALDGLLVLHTMHFADELVDGHSLEIPEPSRAPSDREITMAGALVDSLQHGFEATAFTDSYRERVLELIECKAKGEEIEIPEPAQEEEAPDLMSALEASLEGAGGSRSSGRSRPRSSGRSRSSGGSRSSGSKRGRTRRRR